MSLNKAILVGRVTRDPELRYTPNGRPVASFGLAVDRPTAKGAEKETDFFDIVVWQNTAEIAAKYATKGKLVAIDGRIQVRNYETQDGQKRTKYEIVANDLRLLGGSPRDGAGPAGSSDAGFEAPAREAVYSGAPREAVPTSSAPVDLGLDDIPF